MDVLFPWVEGALRERETLQSTVLQNTKTIHDHESEIQDLQSKVGGLKTNLAKSEARVWDMDAQNKALRAKHVDELGKLSSQHANSMRDTVNKYTTQIRTMNATYETQRQKTRKDHEAFITQQDREHKVKMAEKAKEINQLVGQLLVNQDEDRAWPDNKLKKRYQEVQSIIESITSPNKNKEFNIPKNLEPGPELDPTNFIASAGHHKFHFLLKSGIWEILRTQFFSMPFGFGAFGVGYAQRDALDSYFPWRKMFVTSSEPGRGLQDCNRNGNESANIIDLDDFTIFQSDKLANNLRSTTFQCLSATILAGADRGLPTENPLCDMAQNNVSQTISRVLDYLQQAAALSNNFMRSEIEVEVREMVQVTLEIALQFGVQPAQLQLYKSELGDLVTMGEDFQDCEDADMRKGAQYFVNLVVSPGLRKIGDGGRSTKIITRAIVPCEIYPQELEG
jgi:hypothetical protein